MCTEVDAAVDRTVEQVIATTVEEAGDA